MQSVETIKDLGINYMQGLGTMPKKYYLLNDRIDNRIFDSEEEAFNYLAQVLIQRNWETKWTTISWRELEDNQ